MSTDSIISKVWGFCIVENIEAGLNNFRTVLAALGK